MIALYRSWKTTQKNWILIEGGTPLATAAKGWVFPLGQAIPQRPWDDLGPPLSPWASAPEPLNKREVTLL